LTCVCWLLLGFWFAGSGGGGEDALFSELWSACAGPLVTVPKVGDKVFYFPQGHIEQVSGSCPIWLPLCTAFCL
jgi:hypothetical protein